MAPSCLCNHNIECPLKRAAEARWEEASNVTIKVSTKPCPKCRTPTERDGKYRTHIVAGEGEGAYATNNTHKLLQSILFLRRWLHAHGLHTRWLRLRVVLGVPDRVDA